MSTQLTPMNILRDNIKKKIDAEWDFDIIYGLGKVLEMIEGDELGKPLLEQEKEMFLDAVGQGFELATTHGDLDDDQVKECAEQMFTKLYTKDKDGI